jgi:hypothetical protein
MIILSDFIRQTTESYSLIHTTQYIYEENTSTFYYVKNRGRHLNPVRFSTLGAAKGAKHKQYNISQINELFPSNAAIFVQRLVLLHYLFIQGHMFRQLPSSGLYKNTKSYQLFYLFKLLLHYLASGSLC